MKANIQKEQRTAYWQYIEKIICNIPIDDDKTPTSSNIPTTDEQTDKGDQYIYDGQTVRQGHSIYLRWMKTDKGNQYTYVGLKDKPGQLI
jgi:hypothetical protein